MAGIEHRARFRSWFPALLLAGLTLELTPAASQAMPPTFNEISLAAGADYLHAVVHPAGVPVMAGGVAAGDYDGDGWTDLYVTVLDGPDILFRNNQGTFVDVSATAFAGTTTVTQSNGAGWGDIDNDGDLDLYVTALEEGRYFLYNNNGNGTFTEVATARGADVSGPDAHYGFSVAFGDYDVDGYLDIFMAEWRPDFDNPTGAPPNTRLLHNLGAANPGHFEDLTDAAGVSMDNIQSQTLENAVGSYGFSPRFTDLDADGLPDLAVAADFGTSRLFWNDGDGTFTDGTLAAGVGSDSNGMGSTVGDYNGDGWLDWYVTSIEGASGNRLYENLGNRTFAEVSVAAGVRNGDFGWGASFFDHDNDGDLDIVGTTGWNSPLYDADPMHLWENDGNGVFTDVGPTAGITDTRQGRGLVVFDVDKDGDLAVFGVNNGEHPVLYENIGGNANDWLRVETLGTVSNRDGIGAFITVVPDLSAPGDFMVREIDGGSNFLGQNEIIAHFGLGLNAGTIDLMTVRWPSGVTREYTNVAVNTLMTVAEPIPGDGDLSGEVGPEDYTIWADGFGDGTRFIDGDYNGDGEVSAADYTVWANNYGETITSPSASPVPEPSTFALAGLGLIGLYGGWRRSRRA